MSNKNGKVFRLLVGLLCLLSLSSFLVRPAAGASIQFEGLTFNFADTGTFLTDSSADGSVMVSNNDSLLTITGPNNGDGYPGAANATTTAPSLESVAFDWSYASADSPGFDAGGYLLGATFVQLADSDGSSGSVHFSVKPGETFGFSVTSMDNTGEPGILTISEFQVTGGSSNVPEPSTLLILLGISVWVLAHRNKGANLKMCLRRLRLALAVGALFLFTGRPGLAATQTNYGGYNATGLLTLTGTVNAMDVAHADSLGVSDVKRAMGRRVKQSSGQMEPLPEFPKVLPKHARPPDRRFGSQSFAPQQHSSFPRSFVSAPTVNLMPITGGGVSFNGLTQLDQRDADGGNQFTIEPANPSIAVAENYVLEGVNNAIQVYDSSGNPLLPAPIASNQLFGLAPAYDRTTQIYGPYPTDMRVYYDRDVQRWFVLQRAQDNDMFGNTLASSHLYLAVSQTPDPTATYNIYVADTTDLNNPLCPCFEDYPQIGADRYGFFISSNELNSDSQNLANASILAVSKAALAAGDKAPAAFRFKLPLVTGYEFSVQPATTPPGASYFLANSGVEYFASTVYDSAGESAAVWAMSNTSSLNSDHPAVSLVQTVITTLSYSMPDVASQPDGYRPYGLANYPQAPLPLLDGGDTRALSLSYSGGRLYLTFSTSALDQNSESVVGGALVILSPTLRNKTLAAAVVSQSYLVVPGSNLLRTSIAVNENGIGDIAATLVGPKTYPSAVYVPVSIFSTPKNVYIAGPGTLPEDGFTGYPPYGYIARWGDFSTAVAASDGSIWTASEYIGNLPRTAGANWDTSITHIRP